MRKTYHIVLLLISCQYLFSQVWKKNYTVPGNVGDGLSTMFYLPGKGGFTIGMNGASGYYNKHYMVSFKDNGDTAWTKRLNFDTISAYFNGKMPALSIDIYGNRWIFGYLGYGVGPDSKLFVLKIDSLGNNSNNYYIPIPNENPKGDFGLHLSEDFSYLLYTAYNWDNSIQTYKIKVEKRNSNGLLVWSKSVTTTTNVISPSFLVGFSGNTMAKDNGIVYHLVNGINPLASNRIEKLDKDGNLIFSVSLKNLINPNYSYQVQHIIPCKDTCVVVMAYHQDVNGYNRTHLLKIDGLGVVRDSTSFYGYGNVQGVHPTGLVESNTGSFYLSYIEVINGQWSGKGILKLNKHMQLQQNFHDPFPYFNPSISGFFPNTNDGALIGYRNAYDQPYTKSYFTIVSFDSTLNSVTPNLTSINKSLYNKALVKKVFPNPVKTEFSIYFEKEILVLSVQLFSSDGKLIKQDNVNAIMETINYSALLLETGLYFLKVNTKDGTHMQKLIINR